ncbi:ABC transporter [Synergistales bacterium]|nr:ABC transporter [Synergistales bacterium]
MTGMNDVISIIDNLLDIFSYAFMVRALVAGSLISLCAALLGVSLVLRRCSMIGDGLSHVGFGALAFASALHLAPLAVSIPVVGGAAFLLLRLSANGKIAADASIALVSTSSLALGAIVISKTSGMNIDVYNYMFGSILSVSETDLYLCVALSVVLLVMFILCYDGIFAVTFDETFARACGLGAGAYNVIISLLTALTITLGMRMMGALLITSLIIFPPLTSMRLRKKFKSVVICSALVSVTCFVSGIVLSCLLDTPAGASVVAVNMAAFAAFSLIAALKS